MKNRPPSPIQKKGSVYSVRYVNVRKNGHTKCKYITSSNVFYKH